MPKILRVTTVPISLDKLISGQPKFMTENGFEVVLCSAEGSQVDKVRTREGCRHEVVEMTREITPIKDLKALYQMMRLIRREKPDIIHTHTPKAGIIGMLAGRLTGVPHRIHTVAGLPLQVTKGKKRSLLEAVEKMTYACATEVWPNSYSLYSFILDNRFTKEQKLKVIGRGSTNGIDVNEYMASPDLEALEAIKKKISYDSKGIYLCFVGRLVSDKGINELVEAFRLLCIDYPLVHLILVGPLESELDPLAEETAEEIESNKRIHAVGYSDNVLEYLHLSDIFVFPSHREGFPNVPMQAALQDCPVIASKITGNIDIVDHNENGILHQVRNTTELKEAIIYALEHPLEMQEMASKLKEKVCKNFNRTQVQQHILNEYKSLLDA